jgi:hypothetical protein
MIDEFWIEINILKMELRPIAATHAFISSRQSVCISVRYMEKITFLGNSGGVEFSRIFFEILSMSSNGISENLARVSHETLA